MSYIPAADVAKTVLSFVMDEQIISNTLYWLTAGGWDETALENLADAVIDWATTHLLPNLYASLVLTAVEATDQSSETGPSVTVPVTSGGTGGVSSGGTATNHTAGCVTFRTAERGRSSRGRNYVGGIPQADITGGTTIGAGLIAEILAAYGNLDDVELSETVTHVVVSRYHDLAPRTTAAILPVTTYTMDDAVDSQRRRLRLRGE